jgi:hypothetical protein
VEQRAREKAEGEGKAGEGTQPKGKDQYNFTDPDSRIMPSSEGFVQAYNARAVVEPNFQLIVGQAVTQASNDKQQVQPMVVATEQQSGQRPEELLANSGYCSEKNLEHLDAAGELDKPSQLTLQPSGTSMAKSSKLVRGDGYPRARAG